MRARVYLNRPPPVNEKGHIVGGASPIGLNLRKK
jgi:hypothetical protein